MIKEYLFGRIIYNGYIGNEKLRDDTKIHFFLFVRNTVTLLVFIICLSIIFVIFNIANGFRCIRRAAFM